MSAHKFSIFSAEKNYKKGEIKTLKKLSKKRTKIRIIINYYYLFFFFTFFYLFMFFKIKALRVHPAETRLTVYRRLSVILLAWGIFTNTQRQKIGDMGSEN